MSKPFTTKRLVEVTFWGAVGYLIFSRTSFWESVVGDKLFSKRISTNFLDINRDGHPIYTGKLSKYN